MKAKIILFFLLFLFVKVNADNVIRGTITDGKSGKTLPGANIVITQLSAGTVSDSQGHYTLRNLPNGEFLVSFLYVGYETVARKVTLTGNTQLTLPVALDPVAFQGQEVVVTGSFTSTQRQNTIQINSVSSKSINQTGAPSMMASLAQIPNVSVISKGPGVVTPVIRGLSLSNVLVLQNGIPMENFQFADEHPYMVSSTGLNRVEVIKGPASLMYGSGAVGGVINLISDPVAPEGTVDGSADLKYFSNTLGTNAGIGLRGNNNGFVWGAHVSLNSQEDFLQGNGAFAPNTRFNTQSAKFNVGLVKKIGTFRLFYNYDRDKFGMAVAESLPLVTERGRKNNLSYQNLTDHLLISKNRLFFGKFQLDGDFSFQDNNRRVEANPQTPPFEIVNMTLRTLTYRMKGIYNFSEKFKAFAGIQGLAQSNLNHQAPQHVIPNAAQNDFSVFAMGRYHWNANIITEGGIRFDHRTIFVPSYTNSSTDSLMPDLNRHYNNLSASLGTNFHLSKCWLIRLNLASAFRSPNIAELTQDGLHANQYDIGNWNLKNQRNTEADLGLYYQGTHMKFQISAFYNHIGNYIYLTPTGATTGAGNPIYEYLQTPSEIYGGEAGFSVRPGSLEWLSMEGNYSYLLGRKLSGGYLPLIPANRIHFEITATKSQWHHLSHSFVKIETNYVFAQHHPGQFEVASGAYDLMNLVVGTQVNVNRQWVDLDITASNLFNTVYMDHLSTIQQLGLYDMGRNITVSLHIPFGIKTAERASN